MSALPDLIDDGVVPAMIGAIGSAITAARNVGKPDPEDGDLWVHLYRSGFTTPEIKRHFRNAKAASEACRDG